MLNLNGVVDVSIIREISAYTKLRLKDCNKFVCAEALAMYEQRMLDEDKIHDICVRAVGHDLVSPIISYIPPKIVSYFSRDTVNRSRVIPVSFSPSKNMIVLAYIDDLGTSYVPMEGYNYELCSVPIYYYFEMYVRMFGFHPELNQVPAKTIYDFIIKEAIELDAMDITIASRDTDARVFYNVRKKVRESNRIIGQRDVEDIIKIVCARSPMDYTTYKPKYIGVDLTDDYRGRVVVNHAYHGWALTIRLLSNAAFTKTIEQLNISAEVVGMIRKYMLNRELGLRLVVGSTASGKNTTNLAVLHELVEDKSKKVVSVEMPVEQFLDGVIQIDCEDEEDFTENVQSLLRQNPDIVYITEIGDTNAMDVLTLANTGKIVFSTLHANGCADTIGRLMDITGMSSDKIIQVLHSVMYQELVRDEEEDSIAPKDRIVYFSSERKQKLYGKSYGEMMRLIKEWEGGDVW